MAKRLTPKQRQRVGLIDAGAYSQVQSAVADLAAATVERIDPTTREVFPSRLGISLPDLLTAIISWPVPEHLKRRQTVALDSTDVEAYAARRSYGKTAAPDVVSDALPEIAAPPPKHGPNRRGWPKVGADGRMQHTWDPDAREGYRAGKNLTPKGTFNGWDLHIVSNVPEMGENAMAPLAIAGSFHPAGSSKGTAGLEVLNALHNAGRAPATVLVDRGYSYLRPENWSAQLFTRGIEQVFDLHTNQRGTQPGPIPHTIWVDGGPFTTALPTRLRKLSGYSLSMTVQERTDLAMIYDERKPYSFSSQGNPNRHRGTQRMRGPALAKKVRCPNNPRSMRLDPSTRPTLACSPGECACSTTLTLTLEDEIRTRQRTL